MVPFNTPFLISLSLVPTVYTFFAVTLRSSSLRVDAFIAASIVFITFLTSPSSGGAYLYVVALVAFSASLFSFARWYLSI